MHDQTYHRVLPCNLKGSLRWYAHDRNERAMEARNYHLNSHNVLGDSQPDKHLCQESDCTWSTSSCRSESPCRMERRFLGDIGAIIHHPEVGPAAAERTVVFWKQRENRPSFISPLHPLYEPLQYPLFFPHGYAGYHINMTSLNPPYSKVSQIEYYRQRILTDSY